VSEPLRDHAAPFRKIAAEASVGDNSYGGLRIHALPGLHDDVGARAKTHFATGARVLDLGAGQGALSLRLHDLGFRVTSADLVEANFRLHDRLPFVCADFNDSFAERVGTDFDGVVCLEIIEHLENPRAFLREVARTLKPGGRLLLSTPNVDGPASLALLATEGTFLWFDDTSYRNEGHITPLTQWQLRKCLEEAGLRVVEWASFGAPMRAVEGRPGLALLARTFAWLGKRRGAEAGEILVVTAERA
jgi:2-polyprenyl-3-methyl-5-hydroxy-6-metoxy-1,4-benzoquinol methylase